MSKNLVIISEDNSESDFLLSFASFLKREKFDTFVSADNLKNYLCDKDYACVLIDSEQYGRSVFNKCVNIIRKCSPNSKILVITTSKDAKFLNACIENGVYDFIDKNSLPLILSNRVLNALRALSAEKSLKMADIFINAVNAVNLKTGFYKVKAFGDAYDELVEFPDVKSGAFTVITIHPESKTKVAMNRLAANIRKCIRKTDIAIHGSGKYYLLLPDTSVSGAQIVTEKISSLMKDIKIHSGVAKVGIKSFPELEKDVNNCLKSAIINDKLCVTFENDHLINDWDDESKFKDKHFKLFEKMYEKKFSALIEPLFFRFEKEFDYKLSDADVSQYSNKVESVFCIKNNSKRSEFIIRYDGFAKLNFKIKHLGLDSVENTEETIPLNSLSEKILSKYLKKLYSEFISNK